MLNTAATKGHLQVVELLLSKDVQMESRDIHVRTCFIYYAKYIS